MGTDNRDNPDQRQGPLERALQLLDKINPPVEREYAIKTYRYLRLGMLAMVALLVISIGVEYLHPKVDCFRTSISGYYYTPVRPILVSSFIAVGLALVVIRGFSVLEDICLNVAGLLIPIVAIIPTTGVDPEKACWSVTPSLPKIEIEEDRWVLAPWVTGNIENNIEAMLYLGGLALLVALVMGAARLVRGAEDADASFVPQEWVGVVVTTAVFAGIWLFGLVMYLGFRGSFLSNAHGLSGLGFFGFLILAIVAHVRNRWESDSSDSNAQTLLKWYISIAAAMVVTGLVLLSPLDWTHKVLHLELVGLVLFSVYWVLQTVDNWSRAGSLDVGSSVTSTRAPESTK